MSQSWQTWRHLEDCLNNMMYCCFSVLLLLSHFQPFKYTVFGAVWIIFMFPETYFNIMHCLFAGVDLLLRVDELMNSTWLASLSQLPQTFFYYAFRLGKDLWIMWCPFPDWTSRLPSKHGEVWMLRYIFTFYRNAIPVFLKKKKNSHLLWEGDLFLRSLIYWSGYRKAKSFTPCDVWAKTWRNHCKLWNFPTRSGGMPTCSVQPAKLGQEGLLRPLAWCAAKCNCDKLGLHKSHLHLVPPTGWTGVVQVS